MFLRLFLFISLLASLVVLAPRIARAESAPPPRRSVFAVVITNNKSQKLARPDLRYADDDGARYYELFRTIAPGADVTLLTTFDRDTAKLFPDLREKVAPPEKARVLSTIAEYGSRVRNAVAKGERADFYFVFAGHGDVDQGKGFIELLDGKIDADELTTLIASVPATRSHVILDSCNSFFVLNARKPGGRRFATAADAGERLNRALPNVGVFLSTSAEAETFEWSELGAGIFSHAVRSGLSGAADANGDGEVSYEELAAFVHTAAKEVKNPRYRPNVFARGPGGRGVEALVRLDGAAAARLKLPSKSGRVTLRDVDDVPWIDAHFDTRSTPSLYVPERMAHGATVDIDGVRHRVERDVDGLALAKSEVGVKIAARGPDELFKSLFARPFGPAALAEYKDAVASEAVPVYGVASDDVARMGELLWHASETAKSTRRIQGFGFLTLGAAAIGGAAATAAGSSDPGNHAGAATFGSIYGGVPLVFGAWSLLRSSREEKTYRWFAEERAKNSSSPDFMASAEAQLFALARRDREERMFWRYFGMIYGGLSLGAGALLTVDAAERGETSLARTYGFLYGSVGVLAALPIIGTFTPTYTERIAEIWSRDPSRAQQGARAKSDFSIRPLVGGTSFGLGGTF